MEEKVFEVGDKVKYVRRASYLGAFWDVPGIVQAYTPQQVTVLYEGNQTLYFHPFELEVAE